MAIYNQLYVYIDGALIQENTTVETSLEREDADYFDMRKGWVGMDAGPAFRRISVQNMVPLTGAEYPFEKKHLNKERAEILLVEVAGGKTSLSQGYFTTVSRSAGVGANYTVSFEFRGSAQDFS